MLMFPRKIVCPTSISCIAPFKPLSCLCSCHFSILWNRKKFVLPFPPLSLKIVPISMVADIKNFVQNRSEMNDFNQDCSCLTSCFSPCFSSLFRLFFPLFSCKKDRENNWIFSRFSFDLNHTFLFKVMFFI